MPPLTLTSPRFGALQRPSARARRDELPLLSSAPLSLARRLRERTEKGSFGVGVGVASSALDGSDGVASTSSSTSTSVSSSIADAKASLRAAAPAARGGNPAAVATVLAAVERLAELATASSSPSTSPSSSSTSSSTTTSPSPFPPPPEPSTWETLFTDAKQGSNGKVGPLQGEARQLFEPGNGFLNRVSIPSDALPLLRADFGGKWLQRAGRADRVEVIFERSAFYVLGGLLRVAGSEFPPPGQKGSLKGHWTMKFADDDVRAFVTNKLSIVVLGRVEAK